MRSGRNFLLAMLYFAFEGRLMVCPKEPKSQPSLGAKGLSPVRSSAYVLATCEGDSPKEIASARSERVYRSEDHGEGLPQARRC